MGASTVSALKYRTLWLLIGYGLIALVVYLSVTSNPIRIHTGIPYQDKLFHMLAYFTVTGWFVQLIASRRQLLGWAIVFVLMGLMLEYIQSFEPRRQAEFADMAANTIGVTLGYALSATPLKNTLVHIESWLRS
jgi:VanZ family protein